MRLLLVSLFFLVLNLAHAEIYKWVDENGQVHFSQHPPANQDANRVEPKIDIHENSSSSKRQQEMQRWLNAEEAEQHQVKKKKYENRQKENKQQQQCANARDLLKQYKEATGLYMLDKDGKRKFVDNNRKQQAIDEAQRKVDKACNN